MENNTIFEQIKHVNEIAQEYWSARELFTVLDYIKWDKFLNVIERAKLACKNSGQEPENHFPRVENMVCNQFRPLLVVLYFPCLTI